jgi:hypothetical protein
MAPRKFHLITKSNEYDTYLGGTVTHPLILLQVTLLPVSHIQSRFPHYFSVPAEPQFGSFIDLTTVVLPDKRLLRYPPPD